MPNRKKPHFSLEATLENGMIVKRSPNGATQLTGSFSLSGNLCLSAQMTRDQYLEALARVSRITSVKDLPL